MNIQEIKTFISCNSLDSLPVNRGQLANSCLYSSKVSCDSGIPGFSQSPIVACQEHTVTFTCLDDKKILKQREIVQIILYEANFNVIQNIFLKCPRVRGGISYVKNVKYRVIVQ